MKVLYRQMGLRADQGAAKTTVIVGSIGVCSLVVFILGNILPAKTISYQAVAEIATSTLATTTPEVPIFQVTHVALPGAVKAIYITACTASEKRLRDKALLNFDGTELNSIVIDIKDYTGTVSYASTSVAVPRNIPGVKTGCRIIDLPQFIGELHTRGIYVIGRITVFQDPLYSAAHPELAIRRVSDPSKVWRDTHGLSYIDPGAVPFWEYIISIAKEGYSIGFDELNFDYIRYPSDGNLKDMSLTRSAGRIKPEVLKDFFAYVHQEMGSTSAIISADLFGLTTSAIGDLGIGQVLENALPYFDFVAPMVYPSHFAKGFNGFAKPAEHPYEIIKYSMDKASVKAINASSTPMKLRPWLQDFDLGADYTPAMVRAQIQATYDAGLTSWMLWNAGSVYQKAALATST